MLIDDVTIRVAGGDGGRGAVAFNPVPRALGPTGSDGGRGGDVFFQGVADISALSQFQYKKEILAKHGERGNRRLIDGADAEHIVLSIPVGTVIHNLDTNEIKEMTTVGEKILAARGGRGGWGNYKFRSATNTTPYEFGEGMKGESFSYRLELKLTADVGLVGLPNAGKSSLMNELTGAHSKIGNYPFTTLEPSLGAYYGLILADIPGLIEGAADGKGLGTKFLRHIERTGTLFHLVSAESDDVAADYATIRAELEKYSAELAQKKEYVFLTKSDSVTKAELAQHLAALKKAGVDAQPVSIIDESELKPVVTVLQTLITAKQSATVDNT
jgi:GTP-binding protein